MKSRITSRWVAALGLAAFLLPATLRAQSAETSVDVGPGQAGASGAASGSWQHVDTHSNVGRNGSVARGLAIGTGPNGLALSHSIGVNAHGHGAAHNFNLSIGPGGTHVSHGTVNTSGGNSRVIAGGNATTGSQFGSPSGGSQVTGFGQFTDARTRAETHSLRRSGPPVGQRAVPLGHFGRRPFRGGF